ncbi:MAG: GNAT family N-acetyltransferase [Flammeovirgaceae bacterium]|nr:GNAT family N-acetyltransferase [Flammeovirgaceae bacterium]
MDIGSRFGHLLMTFLGMDLAFVQMKGDEIASLCYSACVVDDLAEIDIVTREEYRGMGLAFVAAQSFMTECVTAIAPTWDCFLNNISFHETCCWGLMRNGNISFLFTQRAISLPVNYKENYQ